MRISTPKLSLENDNLHVRFEIQFNGRDSALWYAVDEQYQSFIQPLCDAALVGLLIPAMAGGEDIYIDGPLSERLFYSAVRPLQAVLKKIIPRLNNIRIHCSNLRTEHQSGPGVATGFSGGVDSFSVLADHHYGEVVPGFQVTHLLFNNVGSHGNLGEKLFNERYQYIKAAAEQIGLPLVRVNSNLDEFFDETLSFQQTHTFRNASVGLLLQKEIGRFLYASAFGYSDIRVQETTSIAMADPITLPLLSTETVDLLAVGSEYSRVEKTTQITTLEDSHDHLAVCVRDREPGNCSTCWKCLRTILTLEIAGKVQLYQNSFDLQLYKKHRFNFLVATLASDSPFSREIVSLMQQRSFNIPAKAVWLAKLSRERSRLRLMRSRITKVMRGARIRRGSGNYPPIR